MATRRDSARRSPQRAPRPKRSRQVVLAPGVVLETTPRYAASFRPRSAPARTARPRAARGGAARTASLDQAIAENDGRVVSTFAVPVERRPPARRARGLRRAAAARRTTPVATLRIETGSNEAAVVLRRNPDGTTTWLYPRATAPARARGAGGPRRARAASGARKREWQIEVLAAPAPRRAPVVRGRGPKRALAGAIAGAIAKVIVFKVAGWLAGELLEHLVARHEKKRLKEGFKRVTAAGFPKPDAPAMKRGDWGAISGKRALVFIHGTFSDAFGAFAKLDRGALAGLIDAYPGGVYAFDHFSLSKDPEENARLFYDSLPLDRGGLELDLVTHSRGGLVARSIAELTARDGVTFHNVVFFGTPNAGTPLADPRRLRECLDLLTNLVGLLPEFSLTFALSSIVAVVQWVAANGVGKLPGLVAQAPDSDLLRRLNDPATKPRARYAAMAANYEAESGLLDRLKDAGMDAVFAADNDLVVPSAGVTQVDADGAREVFRADHTVLFTGGRVFHGNFFAQPETPGFLKRVLR